MKKTFSAEAAYGLGIVLLALGTALMERADFGVSMVVAPAYLIYLRLSETLPFFTFGMAEYTLQAVLLLAMLLALRRFRLYYLFSFVTAVLYGFALDGAMALIALIPGGGLWLRLGFYALGLGFCAAGVSMFFHTYVAPEVYELFVKEASAKFGVEIHRFKTGYDCVSCAIGVILSFCFFGLWHFEGVKAGTILCALINGRLIGLCSRALEKRFDFKDSFPLRKYFS